MNRSNVFAVSQHADGRQAFVNRPLFVWMLGIGATFVLALLLFNRIPKSISHEKPRNHEPKTSTGLNTDDAAPESTIRISRNAVPASRESLEAETRDVAQYLSGMYSKDPAAIHVSAIAHAQLRETAVAEKLWGQCVALAPENPQYRVNLATVAMDRGDSATAVQVLRDLVRGGDTSSDVLLHYGMALTKVGDNEAAEKILSQAVLLYPESASQWSVLGESQLKSESHQQAIESLKRAISLGAQAPEIHFQLATAYRRLGQTESAETHLKIFTDRKREIPTQPEDRFRQLSDAEARQTAIMVMLEAAVVLENQNTAGQQDPERVEIYLLRVLSLDPGNVLATRQLAEHYQKMGAAFEEQAVREHLLLLEPFRFENLLNLAQVTSELKQFDRAEAYLKQAISNQPSAEVAYVALAEFYVQINKYRQAKWYAEELVRKSPSAEGYQFLANVSGLLNDSIDEQQAMEQAAQFSREQ